MYPEKYLHKKPARRPRHQQGMTQSRPGKMQPTISSPPASKRIHGFALQKALLGISNKPGRRTPRRSDGSN